MPGFSTVDTISTLSGRGVGMDVVKRAIASFGGRISISSEPGKGSTFTINLPLTLAVLDGMLVEVANQIVVIPLTSIIETLQPKEGDIHNISPTQQVINVREAFIPLINLSQTFKFGEAKRPSKNSIVLCVETEDGTKSALMVDAIQDQRQVVIKSLEDNYGNVPYIAAATILGDGQIALIADIDELVKAPRSRQAPASQASITPEPAYV
jgi:two-component system chemotaxis sensor kinase CheA